MNQKLWLTLLSAVLLGLLYLATAGGKNPVPAPLLSPNVSPTPKIDPLPKRKPLLPLPWRKGLPDE